LKLVMSFLQSFGASFVLNSKQTAITSLTTPQGFPGLVTTFRHHGREKSYYRVPATNGAHTFADGRQLPNISLQLAFYGQFWNVSQPLFFCKMCSLPTPLKGKKNPAGVTILRNLPKVYETVGITQLQQVRVIMWRPLCLHRLSSHSPITPAVVQTLRSALKRKVAIEATDALTRKSWKVSRDYLVYVTLIFEKSSCHFNLRCATFAPSHCIALCRTRRTAVNSFHPRTYFIAGVKGADVQLNACILLTLAET
jgi:hypothetical protein